jgi:putative ATP-binding cassette transporter
MQLLRLILQTFRRAVCITALVSLLSDVSNAALMVLISRQLTSGVPLTRHSLGALAALVGVAVLCDLSAKWLLLHFTGWMSHALRMHLVRQILDASFQHMEHIGSARLLTTLTADVSTITQGLNSLPPLCVALTTTLGCLAYLGWLSPLALAILGLLAVPTLIGYQCIARRARACARMALHLRDQVFEHYKALLDGLKELTLHRRRRAAFVLRRLPGASQAILSLSWLPSDSRIYTICRLR